ncbi:MAG: hypothetical protein WA857_10250 [Candidatus Acidiferrum sp.]
MFGNSGQQLEVSNRQRLGGVWTRFFALWLVVLALGAVARSQEPQRPAESLAEAARNAREQKLISATHPKIITNADLEAQYVPQSALELAQGPSSTNQTEAPEPPAPGCTNSQAENLQADLANAEGERDRIRRELSSQPPVISDGDLDLANFKPGSSGLDVGAPPLLNTQPPSPARVAEVSLDDKIASLKAALRIACDSPKGAAIQTKMDHAQNELNWLQRQLALDQDTYYSTPNYAQDTAAKAKLDAEQQQAEDLQSKIAQWKDELAASKPTQIAY